MATPRSIHTEADLLKQPRDGRKYELVDGEIRVSPAGMRHGKVASLLTALLVPFVRRQGLGDVYDSSTGYRLPRGNIRSPDLSFVQAGRLGGGETPVGFGEVAPDLAVEILSPEDSQRDVLDKVGEYLEAGTRLVWVIDPARRTAAIHRSLTDVTIVQAGGALDGEDVLPGFSCSLADILS